MKSQSLNIVAEITRVLNLEAQSIAECARRLDSPENQVSLRKAVELFHHSLSQGGKVILIGLGKSGKIAQKISSTLCSTGSFSIYLHPTEGLHGDLGGVRSGDSALILSYTGNTDEIVRLLPSLKSLGTPIIGLGGNPQSKLASESDVWIDGFVEQEACPHNLAPTSSTTLALALGDALALALMQLRGFDAQTFAQNHPGGSLGNRLNLRVSEIMHSGDEVGVLTASATMDEVVMLLTQKPLGAVLVVEGERLTGIIVEGDIRRALKHRQKFFDFRAQDVMTSRPQVARPEMLARAALDLMQKGSRKINVLPVVDNLGNWKGLLRLHDLAQIF